MMCIGSDNKKGVGTCMSGCCQYQRGVIELNVIDGVTVQHWVVTKGEISISWNGSIGTAVTLIRRRRRFIYPIVDRVLCINRHTVTNIVMGETQL